MPGVNKLPVLGYGVRSLDGTILPSTPFDFSAGPPAVNSSGIILDQDIVVIHDKDTYEAAMKSTQLEDDLYSAEKAKFKDIASDIITDTEHVYILIRKRVFQTQSLATGYSIDTTVAAQTIANANPGNFCSLSPFYTAFGDRFISRIDFGAEVVALIRINYIYAYASNEADSSCCVPNKTQLSTNTHLSKKEASALIEKKVKSVLAKGEDSPDANFPISASSASCWLHTAGVELDANAPQMNATTLTDLMSSINDLLVACGKTGQQIALSYKTSPYSTDKINSSVLSTETQAPINQQDLTISLTVIGNYITAVRGLWNDIDRIQKRVNTYLKKYDDQLNQIDQEHEAYRTSKNANIAEAIQKNHDELSLIAVKLREFGDHMVSSIKLKNQHDVKTMRDKIKELQEKAQTLINNYTIRMTNDPIRTVSYLGRKTELFDIPKVQSSHLFFAFTETNKKIPTLELCEVTSNCMGGESIAEITTIDSKNEQISKKFFKDDGETKYFFRPKRTTCLNAFDLFNCNKKDDFEIKIYALDPIDPRTAPNLSEQMEGNKKNEAATLFSNRGRNSFEAKEDEPAPQTKPVIGK